MKTCHIVGAGDFSAVPEIVCGDLLIAADAGYQSLAGAGLSPDLCVGDFDSLGAVPSGCEVIVLPAEKDDTDLLAAARLGLARGYTRFCFYGALGGQRFSHSLAAVQTLGWLAENGARGEILDAGCTITVIADETLSYPAGTQGLLSLFALGDTVIVTLKGLHYPLNEAVVKNTFPLGVSNAFTGQSASVTVRGMAVVITEPA